ncbi:hypothetical protein H4R27_005355 [Coemansia aciculifera]|nr:hypothetical protein H4R27_005355 [Coemansia aciculifera]
MTINNNNVPVVSARSSTQDLESALRVAHKILDEKYCTISELERTIAERDKTIAEHERSLTECNQANVEQRHTINRLERADIEQQRAITERDRVIVEHGQTIAELRHTITKHERVITEQRRTIAKVIERASRRKYKLRLVATVVAPGEAAIDDDTTDDDAAPDNITPCADAPPRAPAPRDDTPPRSDDGAMGNGFDNAASGADDDDLVDAASGAAEDILDDAASRADDALADEISESLHAAKRRRLDQQVLEYMHPFVLIGHSVLAEIVRHLTGHQLVPASGEPWRIAQELAGLEPFTFSTPQRTRACSSELAGLYLLRRSDVDIKTLGSDTMQQLGLAEDSGAVVLGPRLCYVLVTLCGIRVPQMSGANLDKIFREIVGKSLRSLLIVTESGAKHVSPDKLCILAKVWVRKLRKFIVEDGGVERLQEAATRCNNYYMSKCPTGPDGARSDLKGDIAKMVLSDDSNDSSIFLGLNDDAYDLKALSTRLFAIEGSDVDQRQAERLRQIANNM